jgi:hypothetical protein
MSSRGPVYLAGFMMSGTVVTGLYFLIAGLSSMSGGGSAPVPPVPYPLRVALFPYIPDAASDQFAALTTYLETAFETANPSIDLQLRPIEDPNGDFYIGKSLTDWLTGNLSANGTGYHIVEIDAVFLNTLLQASALAPWDLASFNPALNLSDWLPASLAAANFQGAVYGVPHWLCTYMLFSRSADVASAGDMVELTERLAAIDAAGSLATIVNFDASWDLPGYYLQAVSQWYGPGAANAAALSAQINGTIVEHMRQFAGTYRHRLRVPSTWSMPALAVCCLLSPSPVRHVCRYRRQQRVSERHIQRVQSGSRPVRHGRCDGLFRLFRSDVPSPQHGRCAAHRHTFRPCAVGRQ